MGTYGRIYETPLDDKELRHKCPRKIDVAVQAWRNGDRATNPHSDKYRDFIFDVQPYLTNWFYRLG